MAFRKTLLFFWEIIKILVLALVIVLPIRFFVFEPFIVKGDSMETAFHNGDCLITEKLSLTLSMEPNRGDVVVFKYPQDLSQRFIKRIIGLPGGGV